MPLHFEIKLLRHLEIDPNKHKILQPFGGMGQYGIRCDLRNTHPLAEKFGKNVKWKPPDFICDAQKLPFEDNTFDLVFCDPPYSAEEGQKLYGTSPIKYKNVHCRSS